MTKPMFGFDMNKIKAKLEEAKKNQENAKGKKKERDIHSDPLLKVAGPGDYEFRAVPYIHNKDFISDPFPERFYHFGIPGTPIFYCPSMNSGRKEKCAICDCVWEQLKEVKGQKDAKGQPLAKVWNKFLPQKRVWVPGILRGREAEGLKYFPLSTHEDKMGKHHEKLFKALQDKYTYCMLDPQVGYDLILTYEEYDELKSKTLNGAKFGFKELDVARMPSPLADNVEEAWAEIEANMKNVDKDLPRYDTKTYNESLAVVEKWLNAEQTKAKGQAPFKPVDAAKDDDGSDVSSDDATEVSDDDKPVTVAAPAKSEEAPAEDRKARARRMLNSMKG